MDPEGGFGGFGGFGNGGGAHFSTVDPNEIFKMFFSGGGSSGGTGGFSGFDFGGGDDDVFA